MRLLRFPLTVLGAMAMACAAAQTPYPDLTIQDVAWDAGEHHYSVTQKILSPSTPTLPASITGTADAEFVSGTQVRLRPGFHAGAFAGAGRFHAHIDNALDPAGDVVIISPAPDGSEPYGGITDNVIHVHKWEKVEVGLRLPQEYQDAIDRFFQHYYPYPDAAIADDPNNYWHLGPYIAAPGNVDPAHDLNPYADDSLQVVMTLMKPGGTMALKWGFFMREGKWTSTLPSAALDEDFSNVLHPYHFRFRFAPDEEGPWQFSLSAKAPNTFTPSNESLHDLTYTGYAFTCDPPLPDNHGNLEVNPNNNRTLKFEDDTPFFGLGTNMADKRSRNTPPGIHLQDFDHMYGTMDQLHAVGGNFLRMWLLCDLFAPEWVNLGVYDKYRAIHECDQHYLAPPSSAYPPNIFKSNAQFHCWALDKLLDHARENNIYVQLCIDPDPPIVAYQAPVWITHPYLPYLERFLDNTPGESPYDLKRFFYSCEGDVDPDDPQAVRLLDSGVFYYWKRRYKYIMSRWGYSVNVPIIEPFNEIDQMLTYRDFDARLDEDNYSPLCPGYRVEWFADAKLPVTYNDWLTDIIGYVKDPIDQQNPAQSPLGETHKLFLTGTGLDGTGDENYYLPHHNSRVDLADVHIGVFPELHSERSMVDWRNHEGWQHAQDNMANFSLKPFNQGEYTHYTSLKIPNPTEGQPDLINRDDVNGFFHNYDVSFHNEIWTSAFSGRFVAGSSWSWERVFWWNGALPLPPPDDLNQEQLVPFTNAYPGSNNLDIALGIPITIPNRPIHHHFRALADLLNRPSVQDLGVLSGEFTPRAFYDETNANPIECYYLTSGLSTAMGWVHNRNASVAKSFYVKSGTVYENFLGCTAPGTVSITLSGFFPLHAHYITWFPTREGMTDLPPDTEFPETLGSDINGDILIHLDGYFNGIEDNYLDTLHSDYAFVITPQPFVKSMAHVETEAEVESGWDFALYPNPTSDKLTLAFADDTIKDVALVDVSGRRVARYPNITSPVLQIPTDRFARGAYWVQVTSCGNIKTKRLIIQ
ncbi:MAG: T9SS type A sorting domain-containing protein [Flavobacteriales bacterium]|nr:T9SS type A sorting domain-containing protein [Flavobacteriales bacterium]